MNHPCRPHRLARVACFMAAAGVLALLLACGAGRSKRNKQAAPPVLKKAPDVTGVDLDGKAVSLSQYRGKVVVLDVWTTWCPHCIDMLPQLRKLAARLKDRPFVLVSINDDEDKQTVVAFLKKRPMPWVNWWHGEGGVSLGDWQIEVYPTTLVIDHKGMVRYLDPDDLDEAVDTLLAEMAEQEAP